MKIYDKLNTNMTVNRVQMAFIEDFVLLQV